jgi:hypothetical protein
MITKGKAASVIAAIAGVLLFAGSAQANSLGNASFETPDASGGDIAGAGAPWGSFNSNFTSSNLFMPGGGFVNPGAHDGTQVLKQFGSDAGAFQAVNAAEGELWEASAWAINWSGDPFNNLALLQLAFLDSGGGVIGAPVETFCDSIGGQACVLTPQDGGELTDWTQLTVSGVAPAGTASAQILLLHILTDGTPAGGALFWDDASLQIVPVPAAVWLFGSALGLLGFARRRMS